MTAMSVALPDVAVLALGAHTSLGALVPAAAAVRAGIASGQELDLAAFGLPPREAEGARAHPMPELAPTLGGLDRLLAVALPGVGDLRRELAERKLGLGRTGLYLGLGRPAPADAPLTDRVSKAVADALELTLLWRGHLHVADGPHDVTAARVRPPAFA